MFGDDEMDEDAPASSPLQEAAEAAFPGTPWDEDRLAALKELIHLCSGESYDDEEEADEGDKPKSNLALIFGAAPKKKAK
jgi:hypothetical protein